MGSFLNSRIRILLLTNGLILLAAAMLGPIYGLFIEKVGADLLAASCSLAVFSFVAGFVSLLSGKYADRVGEPELVMVVGYVLMACGFFGYMFVSSIWSLLCVQVVIGFGEAIYAPAFDLLYAKNIDGQKPGRQWAAWESMDYFARSFGAISGGLLVKFFGFPIMFFIMGSLCLVSAVYVCMLPRHAL